MKFLAVIILASATVPHTFPQSYVSTTDTTLQTMAGPLKLTDTEFSQALVQFRQPRHLRSTLAPILSLPPQGMFGDIVVISRHYVAKD